MPKEDRATAIGNMRTNLVKTVRVVSQISSWTERQTDTQTYSPQYFATAPAGEVKRVTTVVVSCSRKCSCLVFLTHSVNACYETNLSL